MSAQQSLVLNGKFSRFRRGSNSRHTTNSHCCQIQFERRENHTNTSRTLLLTHDSYLPAAAATPLKHYHAHPPQWHKLFYTHITHKHTHNHTPSQHPSPHACISSLGHRTILTSILPLHHQSPSKTKPHFFLSLSHTHTHIRTSYLRHQTMKPQSPCNPPEFSSPRQFNSLPVLDSSICTANLHTCECGLAVFPTVELNLARLHS